MNAVVVGAGVAGLAAAVTLHGAGAAVTVLEASAAIGGRVRSLTDADGRHLGDLGSSWVWPPYQRELAAWLERLGVGTVAQHDAGDGCLERAPGDPVRRVPLPAQHGQHRPVGGPQAIVDALLARLPRNAVRTGARVTRVRDDGGRLELVTETGERHVAAQAVLAAPLRVVVRDVRFEPALPTALERTLASAPTWMAAQAKALIVYDTPFWRARGLSGRIASAVGPLVEAHDHCGVDAAPAALVGFVGPDAGARAALARERGPDALASAVVDQLVRCLGPEAAAPGVVRIEDWATDPRIAAAADVDRPRSPRGARRHGRRWWVSCW